MEKKKSKFSSRVDELKKNFVDFFKIEPEDAFTSPGRIELLGNHTDHNNGNVLVSTIDLNILALASPIKEHKVIIYSFGFPIMEVSLDDLDKRNDEQGESIGIVRGILFKMKEAGYKVGGFIASTATNVFKGGGVSSSAAFELLIAKIMSFYYNEDKIGSVELAKICRFSEVEYFNKPCGLLDQMGISLGGINYIDFKDNDNPYIKTIRTNLPDYDFVLVNCKDSHSSLTHLYKKIQTDMFTLASHFGKKVLREVSRRDFMSSKDELISKYGENVFLRGKHFYEENERVRKAKDALFTRDQKEFIRLVNESGESSYYQLKNCYVNNENENLPRGILKSKEIIKDGAVRVHGGGFAGTLLAIINKEESNSYMKAIRKMFGYSNVRKITTNRYGTRFICKVKDVVEE